MLQSCEDEEEVAAQEVIAAKAFLSSAPQSIPSGIPTKVILDGIEYDTGGNFSNSRFTATVEGYYQVNAAIYFDDGEDTKFYQVIINKNDIRVSSGSLQSAGIQDLAPNVSDITYLGSGDYLELFIIHNATSTATITNNFAETFMSIHKIN